MLFVDTTIARRLELAEAQFAVEFAGAVAGLHPEVATAVEPIGGGYVTFGGSDAPINRAIGPGLSGPIAEAELDRIEAFFRDRDLPSRIDLCPLADPSLVEILGRRGYRITTFINVHARAVTTDDAAPPGGDVDVSVIGEAEAELFARTVVRGFMGQDEVPSSAFEMALPTTRVPTIRCFLARVDGESAGGGTLSVLDGVAVLAGTSTLVRFRGRGIQTALLRTRLAAAVEAGCDLATVRTLPGTVSERNVQRAGFQLAYTKLLMTRAAR